MRGAFNGALNGGLKKSVVLQICVSNSANLSVTLHWGRVAHGFARFDFEKGDRWEGATGEYAGAFKVALILHPVSRASFVLPYLSDSFMIHRSASFPGDPVPEVSLALVRTGTDAMGFVQTFACVEPDPSDVPDTMLNG